MRPVTRRALGGPCTGLCRCCSTAGQSFSTFVGTQKEWLRQAGVIGSARLRAPAEPLADATYAEYLTLLAEAR